MNRNHDLGEPGIWDGIVFVNDTIHLLGNFNRTLKLMAFYREAGIDSDQLTDLQKQIIRVQVTQLGDKETAKKLIDDWGVKSSKPGAYVSKFIPGNHYHALDQRFNTQSEAINHLEKKGYRYLGLNQKHVYRQQGD